MTQLQLLPEDGAMDTLLEIFDAVKSLGDREAIRHTDGLENARLVIQGAGGTGRPIRGIPRR